MSRPRTLYEKVWDRHVVVPETAETPGVMYVDLHLVHEVTSPQAFAEIEARGLTVRRPDRTFATLDHSTPTLPAGPDGKRPYVTDQARRQVETLEANCARHGVENWRLCGHLAHSLRCRPGRLQGCGTGSAAHIRSGAQRKAGFAALQARKARSRSSTVKTTLWPT